MKIYKYLQFWIAFIFLFTAVSCSKAVKKESVVDTPRDHYLSGLQKLEKNDLNGAEADFNRAIELNKKSPYGHTGMAFLELKRTNYKEALQKVKKALKYGENFVDAYVAKGRIITVREHKKIWFEEAVKPLEKALNLDPENQQALFFLAECYLKAQQYLAAHQFYEEALKKQGPYTEEAKGRFTLVSKIIKAAPVSEKGGYIALDNKIDRSDLCILLIDELQVKNLLKLFRPSLFVELYNEDFSLKDSSDKIPPDVANHLSKKWIRDITPLHISDLNVFPNGFFYPDKLMTRAQFAMVMQEIMVRVKGEHSLSTIYIGSESRFPDVRADYYAFNAITLCVEKGIMDVNPEAGFFDSDTAISGVEAILMIRALENVLGK